MLFDVHYTNSQSGITLTTMLFDDTAENARQQFNERYPFLTLITVVAVPAEIAWQNDPNHTKLP